MSDVSFLATVHKAHLAPTPRGRGSSGRSKGSGAGVDSALTQPLYSKPRIGGDTHFAINHFAGTVTYVQQCVLAPCFSSALTDASSAFGGPMNVL